MEQLGSRSESRDDRANIAGICGQRTANAGDGDANVGRKRFYGRGDESGGSVQSDGTTRRGQKSMVETVEPSHE